MRLCLLLVCLCLVLAACDVVPPKDQQSRAAQKADEHHELRDKIQQPIDRAKSANDSTLKAAEDQRKAIEDTGG